MSARLEMLPQLNPHFSFRLRGEASPHCIFVLLARCEGSAQYDLTGKGLTSLSHDMSDDFSPSWMRSDLNRKLCSTLLALKHDTLTENIGRRQDDVW